MYSNLISHQFNKVILLLVAFDVNICIVFYQIKIYDYDYDYYPYMLGRALIQDRIDTSVTICTFYHSHFFILL